MDAAEVHPTKKLHPKVVVEKSVVPVSLVSAVQPSVTASVVSVSVISISKVQPLTATMLEPQNVEKTSEAVVSLPPPFTNSLIQVFELQLVSSSLSSLSPLTFNPDSLFVPLSHKPVIFPSDPSLLSSGSELLSQSSTFLSSFQVSLSTTLPFNSSTRFSSFAKGAEVTHSAEWVDFIFNSFPDSPESSSSIDDDTVRLIRAIRGPGSYL